MLEKSDFAAVIELSGLACLRWLAVSRRWQVSPGLAKALGLGAQWVEWEEAELSSRLHPDDLGSFSARLSQFLTSHSPFEASTRLRGHHGNWCWFRCSGAADKRNHVITFHEEAVSREARAAMFDSQMRLRSLYDAAPVAIILWSKEGRITGWNHMAESLFGFGQDHAIGKKLTPLLINPAEHARFSSAVSVAVRENIVGQLNCRSLTATGSEILCDWRTVALRGPKGMLMGLLSLALDITAAQAAADALRHARDHAEALSQAKSEFLAIVSHELRTPLNGVLGAAQLLEASLAGPELEYAQLIYRSGEQLLSIIASLIDYTDIDARPLNEACEAFSPAECLALRAEAFAWKAKQKGLNFVLDLAEPLWNEAWGDRRSLEKIFDALLDNAVKFTERGGIRVGLALQSQDTSGMHLSCCIQDTGCGIPAEQLPVLFTPFCQAESANTRRHGGVGLGLALAKKLSDRLDGKLSLTSTPSEGTTCRLSFRLAPLP